MRAHPAGPRHGEDQNEHGNRPRPRDAAEVLAIDPEIWPGSTRRGNIDGALSIGGVDVRDLVGEYGTPVFVMDEVDFRARARAYDDAFDDPAMPADVFFAAKSFICTAVARWVHEQGLGIDVCTGGELATALRAGVPAANLLMHGNNKSSEELRAAIEAGVGLIVMDSFADIARASFIAGELGVRQRVLVRITVGVEAHTHEFISTAHEDQKFGFSLAAGDAAEAVRRVMQMPSLELIGIHSHIGSQIFVPSGFEVATGRAVAFLAEVRDEHGQELSMLNLGGGLGIKYVAGDEPPDVHEMSDDLRRIVRDECAKHSLAIPRLAFEPGRAIVGPSTVTLYTVGTVKPVHMGNGGSRTYVSVDGGMSDNIRTALYDAHYTVTLASRRSDAELILCRIVGKHCESGDIVINECWLPSDIAIGDVLAVAATGAYNRSMASNYNLVTRPPVIGVRDGQTQVLLRRETLKDLFALDPG